MPFVVYIEKQAGCFKEGRSQKGTKATVTCRSIQLRIMPLCDSSSTLSLFNFHTLVCIQHYSATPKSELTEERPFQQFFKLCPVGSGEIALPRPLFEKRVAWLEMSYVSTFSRVLWPQSCRSHILAGRGQFGFLVEVTNCHDAFALNRTTAENVRSFEPVGCTALQSVGAAWAPTCVDWLPLPESPQDRSGTAWEMNIRTVARIDLWLHFIAFGCRQDYFSGFQETRAARERLWGKRSDTATNLLQERASGRLILVARSRQASGQLVSSFLTRTRSATDFHSVLSCSSLSVVKIFNSYWVLVTTKKQPMRVVKMTKSFYSFLWGGLNLTGANLWQSLDFCCESTPIQSKRRKKASLTFRVKSLGKLSDVYRWTTESKWQKQMRKTHHCHKRMKVWCEQIEEDDVFLS